MPYLTGLCFSFIIAALYILFPFLASNPQASRSEKLEVLALAVAVTLLFPLLFL